MATFPLPRHADGRLSRISDGFHSIDDVHAGRAKRQHRGNDLMYRKFLPNSPQHPYGSKWYEIPKPASLGGYDVPVLATETGIVVAAGTLSTGGWVALDYGGGRGVAYHHLSSVLVTTGPVVGEGTPLGFVGGSPVGYGLWHVHWDMAVGCKFDRVRLAKLGRLDGTFIDGAAYLAKCQHVALAEVWGEEGRVG